MKHHSQSINLNTAIVTDFVGLPYDVQFNATPIEKLFAQYEAIGFLYPTKKALLTPYFEDITANWKKLFFSNGEETLLWVLSAQEDQGDFASISVWQHNNSGLFAQHLVSTGNPFLSLRVMLAAQYKAQLTNVQSSQNWFRPNNRYAYRVFASMFDKLGANKASLIEFQYLHLSCQSSSVISTNSSLQMEEVLGKDPELSRFVSGEYGSVFVKAEELDQEDIQLKKLGNTFQKYQAELNRSVFKVRDLNSNRIVAVAVANRASIGLNFSFLENRAYYIIDAKLDDGIRSQVLQIINLKLKQVYADFPLGLIPIVTDKKSAESLIGLGAKLQRVYMQSIWLRDGFAQWYDHIDSFLKKIERRKLKTVKG